MPSTSHDVSVNSFGLNRDLGGKSRLLDFISYRWFTDKVSSAPSDFSAYVLSFAAIDGYPGMEL
jgi:hypothetical protein